MMKKITLLCLFALTFAVIVPQTNAQTARAEWTIMMYGAMDNDFEHC